jgi:hypothetical protein
LRFHFSVGVAGEVEQTSMRLSGFAEYADTDFPVPGSSAISEWDLAWRDENDGVAGEAKTLDEFRALIKKN